MCSVIGYVPHNIRNEETVKAAFARLVDESSIRGLHAFGIVDHAKLVRSHDIGDVMKAFDPHFVTAAHCRYCTSGDTSLQNSQPLALGALTLVFNGVIHMGSKEEFEQAYSVSCRTNNDGEIFLQLLEKTSALDAWSLITARGASFAGLWFDRTPTGRGLWVGRNTKRPLWWASHLGAGWYASTQDIFLRAGFPEPSKMEPGIAFEEAWSAA